MPWVWRRYGSYQRYRGRYAWYRRPGAGRRPARPAGPYREQERAEIEPVTKRISLVFPERGEGIERGDRSAMVKLTYNVSFPFVSTEDGSSVGNPFQFTCNAVPGFTDYSSVYSQFRLLRASLTVPPLQQGNTLNSIRNFLVVSSQPFANTAVPVAAAPVAGTWVPSQPEEALRQARWQRVVYPDSNQTGVTFWFYPYTMIAGYGPSTSNDYRYQRVWRGRNWTPFVWATTNPLEWFGPYVWAQRTVDDGNPDFSVPVTLTLYCQFKGQK